MGNDGLEYEDYYGIQNSPLLSPVRPSLTFSPNLNHQFLIEPADSFFCPTCGIQSFTDVGVLDHMLECTSGVTQDYPELNTSHYSEKIPAVDKIMQDVESSIHSDAQNSPLRQAYLQKLGRKAVFEEYHRDILLKKTTLDESQKMKHIAGLELSPGDLDFLRNFRDEANRITKERKVIAIDLERLKRQCIENGVLGETEELERLVSYDAGQIAAIKGSESVGAGALDVTANGFNGFIETEPDWYADALFPDARGALEPLFNTSSQDQHRQYGSSTNNMVQRSRSLEDGKRPHKCFVRGCEEILGFASMLDLWRHEKDAHKRHYGPETPLYYPYSSCDRHKGIGFSGPTILGMHIQGKDSNTATDTATLFHSDKTNDERNNVQPDGSQKHVQLNPEFEQSFLGALKKHLPSLFPLVLQDATTQHMQPIPESRKHSRDEEPQEMPCKKHQRTEYDEYHRMNMAMGHLETEFLYNPIPDAARIHALSVFTYLEISFVAEWFKRKNQDIPIDAPRNDPGRLPVETPLPINQLAKRDHKTVNLAGSDIVQRWTKHLREAKNTSQNNRTERYSNSEEILAKHRPASGIDVDKPYSCTKEGCSMKFKTKCDWRRHEETHYPQSEFICLLKPECKSKIFPRKDKFLEHLRKCHNNETFRPEMKDWRQPTASNTIPGCPCCDQKFTTWLDRCIHITVIMGECRRVAMKGHWLILSLSQASNEVDSGNQRHPQTNVENVEIAEDDHDASMDQNSAAKLSLPQSRENGCDKASSYYFKKGLRARMHFVAGYKVGLCMA